MLRRLLCLWCCVVMTVDGPRLVRNLRPITEYQTAPKLPSTLTRHHQTPSARKYSATSCLLYAPNLANPSFIYRESLKMAEPSPNPAQVPESETPITNGTPAVADVEMADPAPAPAPEVQTFSFMITASILTIPFSKPPTKSPPPQSKLQLQSQTPLPSNPPSKPHHLHPAQRLSFSPHHQRRRATAHIPVHPLSRRPRSRFRMGARRGCI